ncbi:MAG TPA: SLC13 family permease [Methanoregula sp.]|nr:SLC13 family permease [Methanoregula sp.]
MGRFTFKIWQVMLGGAVAVLLLGQIAPADALAAINIDVMVFLFGMFVVGEALSRSGYLDQISSRFFRHARSPGQLLALVIFGFGALSALLMNDTLAIIGTPLVLGLAAQSRLPKKMLLFALAFAITTGSVASPIGNPQNLLVAVNSGMTAPFVTFAFWLLVPTIAGLAAAWLVLRYSYSREISPAESATGEPEPVVVPDPALTRIVKCSLVILIGLAIANIIVSLLTGAIVIPLPLIGLAAALPIILFSGERVAVLKAIDWCTLVFFAAMFILMAAVWQTGFFQSLAGVAGVTSVPAILGTSVVISQFISNVPFVALFQPLIMQAGGTTAQLMALAAGSTIAGNLTILGAASNVIIIQQAEARGETLTFMEFAKIGVPLTLIQIGIYAAFLGAV